jgi:hypothetical protein
MTRFLAHLALTQYRSEFTDKYAFGRAGMSLEVHDRTWTPRSRS